MINDLMIDDMVMFAIIIFFLLILERDERRES